MADLWVSKENPGNQSATLKGNNLRVWEFLYEGDSVQSEQILLSYLITSSNDEILSKLSW